MIVEQDDIAKTVGLILGRKNVAASDCLMEDLGAESADLLNIIASVEDKYQITIDDVDVPSFAQSKT